MPRLKRTLKLAVHRVANNSRHARMVIYRIGNKRLKKRFDLLKNRTKVEEKTIIFTSFLGRSYAGSPRAMYLEMLDDSFFNDWRFIWACSEDNILNRKNSSALKDDPNDQYSRMKVLDYGSEEYYRYLAKSQYWITNSRLPEGIYPGKNNVCVQTWHGTPLKKLGADIENSNESIQGRDRLARAYKNEAEKWDYLVSPSKFNTEKMKSAFSIRKDSKPKILEVGYPRNDFLVTHSKEDIERVKQDLHIPEGKKVLLYTPTWRDDQHDYKKGFTYKLGVDFELLSKALAGDWVVLFRSHYFIADRLDLSKYRGFVYDVSRYNEINDLYIISDALMTDYSSVFFDYSILQKPIIFFMYDKEFYVNKLRGFYMSLDELPGDIVETNSEVIDTLFDLGGYTKKYEKKLKKFKDEYCSLEDGKASVRVINEIFKGRN